MYLMTLIKASYTDFADLCRSHRVNKLHAFGSSISTRFNAKKKVTLTL